MKDFVTHLRSCDLYSMEGKDIQDFNQRIAMITYTLKKTCGCDVENVSKVRETGHRQPIYWEN